MTRKSPTPAASKQGLPTAISADLLRPVPVRFNLLMLSLVGVVATFVAWSAFATLDETTKGQGRIVPASKIQLVQNLEGGIVRDIRVREGQTVQKGDVLLRIDPTQANSSVGEALERVAGLRVVIARLDAETKGVALSFPEQFEKDHPGLVTQERALFDVRQKELAAALDALDAQEQQRRQEKIELEAKTENLKLSLKIAQAELNIVEPLAETQAASASELLAVRAKLNEVQGSLTATQLAIPRIRSQIREAVQKKIEKRSAFRSDALQKSTKARIELNALLKANQGDADKLARTTVRAPASGVVKTIHVTTVGQVIQPGRDLVEIVPLNDTLLVETRIRPQDIAFLRPGQPALVKLTAYDFSLYGGLNGKVEQIGADSIIDDKGETYYLVKVRTHTSQISHKGKGLRVLPGMVADVDVLTGKKTVLAYLTKPLTRMRDNALRER